LPLVPTSLSLHVSLFFVFHVRLPPRSILFPYTTLFRSVLGPARGARTRRRRSCTGRPGCGSARAPAIAHGHWGTRPRAGSRQRPDRKSTRLNSSHVSISYAVFCLKKKNRARTAKTSHTR